MLEVVRAKKKVLRASTKLHSIYVTLRSFSFPFFFLSSCFCSFSVVCFFFGAIFCRSSFFVLSFFSVFLHEQQRSVRDDDRCLYKSVGLSNVNSFFFVSNEIFNVQRYNNFFFFLLFDCFFLFFPSPFHPSPEFPERNCTKLRAFFPK